MSLVLVVLILFIILGCSFTTFVIYRMSVTHGKIIVNVDEETGKIIYTLEVDIDPGTIRGMDRVTFKVVKNPPTAD